MQIEGGETAPQTLTHPFKVISPPPRPPLPPHPRLKGLAGPELIACSSALLPPSPPAFFLSPPLPGLSGSPRVQLPQRATPQPPLAVGAPAQAPVLREGGTQWPLVCPESRNPRHAICTCQRGHPAGGPGSLPLPPQVEYAEKHGGRRKEVRKHRRVPSTNSLDHRMR